MRIERSEPKKNKHTKVLFKKSDLTVGRSSIFSDASQRHFKTAINRIKKDFHRHDYYTHKGKLKRDLSLETDNCILRRYFKYKLTSLASSAKSKYSNYNEAETIEEFEESSGSGDNKKITEEDISNSYSSDITVLMENLRNLLNIWVREHLTDDSGAKKKFNHVLDSILDKLNVEETKDSSRTTYVLGKDSKSIEIKYGSPGTTNSGICKACKKRRKPVSATKLKKLYKRKSYHSPRSSPYHGISSLSVPKYVCENNIKTIYAKDQKPKSLKINRTVTEELSTSENETLVGMKLAKQNSKSPETHFIAQSNIRLVKLFPKSFYRYSMETKLKKNSCMLKNKNLANFDTLPSLVRTMYVRDSVNIMSTNADFVKNKNKEMYTMTDCEVTIQSRSAFTMISKQSVQNKNATILSDNGNRTITDKSLTTDNNLESDVTAATILNKQNFLKHENGHSKSKERRKPMRYGSKTKRNARKRRNIYSRLSRLHITDKTSESPSATDFLEHVKTIIKYFFENSGTKDIQFDININLNPIIDQDVKENNEDSNNKANENVGNNDKQSLNPLSNKEGEKLCPPSMFVYTNNTCTPYPAIIPILDGAASRAKYMLESKNSTEEDSDLSQNNNEMDNHNVTCKDIIEIKAMVKDISKRTEKLVCEHFKRKIETSHKIDANIEDRLPVTSNPSPAIIEVKTSTSHTNTDPLKMPYISDRDEVSETTTTEPRIGNVLNEYIVNNIWTTSIDAQSQTINNITSETNSDTKLLATPNHSKISVQVSTAPCLLDADKQLTVETLSKEIQVSTARSKLPATGFSGLKVTKEPKKSDTSNKCINKTVSYNIIESEAILQVTDMTVAEQMIDHSEVKSPKPTSKTNSLTNVQLNNQTPHIITFYCDKCSKKCEFLYNKYKSDDLASSLSKTALTHADCGDNTTLENNNVPHDTDVENLKSNITRSKPSWQIITFYFTVVFIIATGVTCAVYFYVLSNRKVETITTLEETSVTDAPIKHRYNPFTNHRKRTKTSGVRWFSSELGF